LKGLVAKAEGLSFAEIAKATDDALKSALMTDNSSVSTKLVEQMLLERQGMRQAWQKLVGVN
jgi:AAA+ superfamily predicted ATPase